MRKAYGIAIVMSALAGVALAKLPPLTPEQQEAAAAKKEKEQGQLEQQQKALTRAQDRVAELYKRTKGGSGGSPPAAGQTEKSNMPKTTAALPRDAGTKGGREPSAEAHSGQVK